jgi:ribonuclease-3
VPHNERLEFLGDAALEIVVSEYLFKTYAKAQEGELTQMRSNLVRTDSLLATARVVGIERYILMSRGEAKDTGRARELILEDAFEAIIGAVYLDQGMEAARAFIQKTVLKDAHATATDVKDAISLLQELAQQDFKATPEYKLHSETGPDHARSFVMGVYIGSRLLGLGEGNSKKIARSKAAEDALASGWK